MWCSVVWPYLPEVVFVGTVPAVVVLLVVPVVVVADVVVVLTAVSEVVIPEQRTERQRLVVFCRD